MKNIKILKKVMVAIIVALVLATGLNVVPNHNQEEVQAARVSKRMKKITKNCHKYFDYEKRNKKFVQQLDKRITKIYGKDVAWSLSCKSNKIVIEVE